MTVSDKDVALRSDGAFYFGGPDSEGTWRIVRDGESLSFQRLEEGRWVHKLTINP